jgi:hypothetical protein
MATAIGNCPQLRSLYVCYEGTSRGGVPLVTLRHLFAKIPTNNPLRLEHLSMKIIDATIDQFTLPHLTNLISFGSNIREDSFTARSIWTSFMVNHIELSDVVIEGIITEEAMAYLSSFSGLKRLTVYPSATTRNLEAMLFAEVLPNHVNSLQELKIWDFTDNGLVKLSYYFLC